MLQEKRAREISGSSLPVEVGPDSNIKELAAAFMQAWRYGNTDPTALVKEGNNIVGMINQADLLDALEPSYTKGAIKTEIFWQGLLTERWRGIANYKVKELMRPPVVVDANDTLMKVSHVLNTQGAGMVLVVDGERLVGTITAGDILKELMQSTPENLCSRHIQHPAEKSLANAGAR